MADKTQLMSVRPPLVIAQRAAVGEVAIPIAKAVDALVKLTPVAGELLAALEVVSGKSLGGLGFDLPASERALTAILVAAPYAASALKAGVRGGAVPIGERFADYQLVSATTRGHRVSWKAVPLPVVVRVHPSVLKSDEAIVGVLQHEAYELQRLSATMERRSLTAEQISTMIDGRGASNIHGQAWDVADLRVLIMRETDPVRKAVLLERMKTMTAKFDLMVDK